MQGALKIRLWIRRSGKQKRLIPAIFLKIAGVALVQSPVYAQSTVPRESPVQGSAQPLCIVQSNAKLGAPKVLVAFCGGHGTILGPADEFSVFPNETAQAVVVDIRNKGVRKILLVSDQGKGQPLLEDISGQISMSAGKGPMAPLEDMNIDLSSFGADGVIFVVSRARDGKAGRIDLGRQIAGARTARLAVGK